MLRRTLFSWAPVCQVLVTLFFVSALGCDHASFEPAVDAYGAADVSLPLPTIELSVGDQVRLIRGDTSVFPPEAYFELGEVLRIQDDRALVQLSMGATWCSTSELYLEEAEPVAEEPEAEPVDPLTRLLEISETNVEQTAKLVDAVTRLSELVVELHATQPTPTPGPTPQDKAWREIADMILDGTIVDTQSLLRVVDTVTVDGGHLDAARVEAVRGVNRVIEPKTRHEWSAWVLGEGPMPSVSVVTTKSPIVVDALCAAIIYDKSRGATTEMNRAQHWGLTHLPGRFAMLGVDETTSSLMNEAQWVRDAFAARGSEVPWLIVASPTHGLSARFESLQQLVDATQLERN